MSEKQKISENLRRLAKQHAINNFSIGEGEFYESAAEPSFISGFLATNSIMGSLLQLVQVVVIGLIWFPFLKMIDRSDQSL